jgi:hypothetical protein
MKFMIDYIFTIFSSPSYIYKKDYHLSNFKIFPEATILDDEPTSHLPKLLEHQIFKRTIKRVPSKHITNINELSRFQN